MKTTMVLFTATLFASLTMAAGAPSREEVHRAKYGRYIQTAKTPVEAENAVPDCCRSLSGAGNATLAEERNRVKYGRYSPANEVRVQEAVAAAAIHGRACRLLDHCPLPTETRPEVAAVTTGDARLLAKYGRVFSAKNAPAAVSVARRAEPCEHACCQASE